MTIRTIRTDRPTAIWFAVLVDLLLEFLSWLAAGAAERLGNAFGDWILKRLKKYKAKRKRQKERKGE